MDSVVIGIVMSYGVFSAILATAVALSLPFVVAYLIAKIIERMK